MERTLYLQNFVIETMVRPRLVFTFVIYFKMLLQELIIY